jgi:hypothetical protein
VETRRQRDYQQCVGKAGYTTGATSILAKGSNLDTLGRMFFHLLAFKDKHGNCGGLSCTISGRYAIGSWGKKMLPPVHLTCVGVVLVVVVVVVVVTAEFTRLTT